MKLWGHCRVDGVGRPEFDFHTVVNDRLVGGARRHESLPAQTTWDFERDRGAGLATTWLLERDRGAGLARRRTRATRSIL